MGTYAFGGALHGLLAKRQLRLQAIDARATGQHLAGNRRCFEGSRRRLEVTRTAKCWRKESRIEKDHALHLTEPEMAQHQVPPTVSDSEYTHHSGHIAQKSLAAGTAYLEHLCFA